MKRQTKAIATPIAATVAMFLLGTGIAKADCQTDRNSYGYEEETEMNNHIVEGGCTGIPRGQPPRPPVPGTKMVFISHLRMWAFFAGFFVSGFLMGAAWSAGCAYDLRRLRNPAQDCGCEPLRWERIDLTGWDDPARRN